VITRQALFAAVVVQVLAGGPAWAQGLPGEPDRGRALAERWCVECHEIAPGKRQPWAVRVPPAADREPGVVEVPSFQAVADDPAATEAALRAFLRTPHAAMPDLRLTLDQTDDVVAYVLSLKGRRPGT
jgi:mono/diheme cytochrome c family protein